MNSHNLWLGLIGMYNLIGGDALFLLVLLILSLLVVFVLKKLTSARRVVTCTSSTWLYSFAVTKDTSTCSAFGKHDYSLPVQVKPGWRESFSVIISKLQNANAPVLAITFLLIPLL